MVVKFLITGDIHLDVSFPIQIKRERVDDFNNIFKQIVEKAIANKVDAILHLGDLFDNYRPAPNIVNFVRTQLVKLKNAGIMFLTIFGNHDSAGDNDSLYNGISIDYIKLAEDNIVDLIDPRFDAARGIDTVGYRDIKNVRIYGVGCYKQNTTKIINNYIIPENIDKSKYNILLLHIFVDQINNLKYSKEKKVSFNTIEKFSFDLVSIGHMHIFKHNYGVFKPGETLYLCPGSPINWSFEQLGTSGCYIVSIDPEKKTCEYKFHLISSKYIMKKIFIESDIEQSAEYYKNEIFKRIEKIINDSDKQLILSIKLKGKLLESETIDGIAIEKEILSKFGNRILYLSNIKSLNLIHEYLSIEEIETQKNTINNDEIISEAFKKYFTPKISQVFNDSYTIIRNAYNDNYENLQKSGNLPKKIRYPLDNKIKESIILTIKGSTLNELQQKATNIIPKKDVNKTQINNIIKKDSINKKDGKKLKKDITTFFR